MGLFGCNLQNKMLYYPSSAAPSPELLAALHLRYWPSPGEDYRGLAPANGMPYSNGTILWFHGNGGTAVDRQFYTDTLGRLGYRVILAEYPMYGGRAGKLGEESFVSDAVETMRMAQGTYGRPFYVAGESLGCGVAAAAVGSASVEIDGIILLTPWDTLADVAKTHYPFLPVRLFLTDKYDSIRNLSSFKGKIAVVGAAMDEVIPIRHTENLFDSLPTERKKMWIVPDAGHNTWTNHVTIDWWKEITTFIGLHP
jgi:pimeloyl-ACP methyl ester carboxylesterase